MTPEADPRRGGPDPPPRLYDTLLATSDKTPGFDNRGANGVFIPCSADMLHPTGRPLIVKPKMKYARIEREHLERARADWKAVENETLVECRSPHRVIEGAAIVRKHVPGGRILDVGAGQAEVMSVLARDDRYECFCCDDFRDSWQEELGAEAMIESIRKRGVTVKHVQNAAVEFPYEDASFDCVFCCDLIEHLHHTPRFLMGEIHRVLRPGGTVAIGMPNASNLRKRIDVVRGGTAYVNLDTYYNDGVDYRGHVREFTPHEVWQMLGYARFRPVATYMFDWSAYRRLSGYKLKLYLKLSPLLRSARDSYIVVGTKDE